LNPPTSINGETVGEGEELDGEEREDEEYLRDISGRRISQGFHFEINERALLLEEFACTVTWNLKCNKLKFKNIRISVRVKRKIKKCNFISKNNIETLNKFYRLILVSTL